MPGNTARQLGGCCHKSAFGKLKSMTNRSLEMKTDSSSLEDTSVCLSVAILEISGAFHPEPLFDVKATLSPVTSGTVGILLRHILFHLLNRNMKCKNFYILGKFSYL